MAAIRVADSRHGVFVYHSEDRFVGTSLRIYGEYSEGEVDVYRDLLKPTDIAIEVGANIGALTVPLARYCEHVFTFEPQPDSYKLLRHNLKSNGVTNVTAYPYAVGAAEGQGHMPSVDEIDLNFGRVEFGAGSCMAELHTLDKILSSVEVTFIKMDCEGMELEVFQGGDKLITRTQPVIYVENDRPEKSEALIAWLVDHGYECYWHRPPLFRSDNFNRHADNIFGVCDSKNMLCYPCEYKGPVVSWITEAVVV